MNVLSGAFKVQKSKNTTTESSWLGLKVNQSS